jgi:hypothetical protein
MSRWLGNTYCIFANAAMPLLNIAIVFLAGSSGALRIKPNSIITLMIAFNVFLVQQQTWPDQVKPERP